MNARKDLRIQANEQSGAKWRSYYLQHPDHIRPWLWSSGNVTPSNASRSDVNSFRHSAVISSCDNEEMAGRDNRDRCPPPAAWSRTLLFLEKVESRRPAHRVIVSLAVAKHLQDS